MLLAAHTQNPTPRTLMKSWASTPGGRAGCGEVRRDGRDHLVEPFHLRRFLIDRFEADGPPRVQELGRHSRAVLLARGSFPPIEPAASPILAGSIVPTDRLCPKALSPILGPEA